MLASRTQLPASVVLEQQIQAIRDQLLAAMNASVGALPADVNALFSQLNTLQDQLSKEPKHLWWVPPMDSTGPDIPTILGALPHEAFLARNGIIDTYIAELKPLKDRIQDNGQSGLQAKVTSFLRELQVSANLNPSDATALARQQLTAAVYVGSGYAAAELGHHYVLCAELGLELAKKTSPTAPRVADTHRAAAENMKMAARAFLTGYVYAKNAQGNNDILCFVEAARLFLNAAQQDPKNTNAIILSAILQALRAVYNMPGSTYASHRLYVSTRLDVTQMLSRYYSRLCLRDFADNSDATDTLAIDQTSFDATESALSTHQCHRYRNAQNFLYWTARLWAGLDMPDAQLDTLFPTVIGDGLLAGGTQWLLHDVDPGTLMPREDTRENVSMRLALTQHIGLFVIAHAPQTLFSLVTPQRLQSPLDSGHTISIYNSATVLDAVNACRELQRLEPIPSAFCPQTARYQAAARDQEMQQQVAIAGGAPARLLLAAAPHRLQQGGGCSPAHDSDAPGASGSGYRHGGAGY